jgi:DNA-binding HxlR family transcriptional regulator
MPNSLASIPPKSCAISRSLDVLGEKWTFLIVREAFWGSTRFSEFKETLGVSSDILTGRLATLVEAGALERRSYREDGSRERFSYHLTTGGRELMVVLAALAQWGDDHRPSETGRTPVYRDSTTHERLHVAFVAADGTERSIDEVEIVRASQAA